jgi:hypothetical protein
MLKFSIESFLLNAGKARPTLVKVVFGQTNAYAAMIANGVITLFRMTTSGSAGATQPEREHPTALL